MKSDLRSARPAAAPPDELLRLREPAATPVSLTEKNADDEKAPSFEGAFRQPNGEARRTIYRARRTAFFVRAFAFTVDLRAARFTVRVVFAFAAFAGRVTLV